jgi:predicted permease
MKWNLGQDLRHAARSLLRAPGFSLVAVLVVALGVGAATTIFSSINALVLRDFPAPAAERLVTLSERRDQGVHSYFSFPQYREYAARTGGFEGLAASAHVTFSVSVGDEAEARVGEFVSGNYFNLLRLAPQHGRWLVPEDDVASGYPVAVISHSLWQSRFGGAPDVPGRVMQVNGRTLTIVGIAEPEFSGLVVPVRTDVWVPLAMYPELMPGEREAFLQWDALDWLTIFGRLAPGISLAAAGSAADAAALSIAADFPTEQAVRGAELQGLKVLPVAMRGPVGGFLVVLLALASLLLLIASVNVAGMLLARGASRRRELAIRSAVGARRGRLLRLILAESVLLFGGGAVAGAMIASGLTSYLATVRTPLEGSFPIELALDPDWRVFLFALAIALAAGLAAGLAPALSATRGELLPALRGVEPGGRSSRMRSATVAVQIAASLVLLVAAGLFLRSLQEAARVDIGLDPEGVWSASVDLSPHGYDAARGRALYAELRERAIGIPGVSDAALGGPLRLGFGSSRMNARVHHAGAPHDGTVLDLDFTTVGEGYFQTLRTPLLRGRDFGPQDDLDAPRAVIINETMAGRFWPGRSALGERITFASRDWMVVGVAADGKYRTLHEEPLPYLWVPLSQRYSPSIALFLRTAPGAGDPMPALRRELRDLAPELPLMDASPLHQRIAFATFPQRLAATLSGLFGFLGALLAAVGIYGVIAFTVAQRTREIGIRIALGATRRDVLAIVLRGGARLVLAGLALGLLAAFGVTRLIGNLLFGVAALDPLTFVTVPLLLAGVALLASYLPARRATRVEPMRALRAD